MEVGEGMKLEFTSNVLARMLDRGIREGEIQTVVDAPDYLGPSLEKCWHARKQMNGRTLEVIFSRHRTHAQIITAYWQDASA